MTTKDQAEGGDVGATGCAAPLDRDGVYRFGAIDVRVAAGVPWSYATAQAAAIDAHWAEALRQSPKYFNGNVHMTHWVRCDGGTLTAEMIRVDFKAYLYWRACGFPSAGIIDAFGSALIRTADDAVVLVRQRPGQVNSGLYYLPGGFVDGDDMAADGRVDLRGSVNREVLEETGLDGDALEVLPGYWVTRAGPHLSIAVGYLIAMPAAETLEHINRYIAAHPDGELESAIAVRRVQDLQHLAMPEYARRLLHHIFDGCDGSPE